MGCGISKFDPKEVVEACPNNPSPGNNRSSNCFTGESKSLIEEGGGNRVCSYPEERSRKGDSSWSAAEDQGAKMNNMKLTGETEEKNHKRRTRTMEMESEDYSDHEKDENDENCRMICRGGSPSFREYCVDSDSRSRSFRSEGICEGNSCKWPYERTINPEKQGSEGEMGKKERRGKSLMNAIQRGKSGGVRNFLSASRRQNPNFPSPPHRLHDNAKAS